MKPEECNTENNDIYPKFKIIEYCNHYDYKEDKYTFSASIEIKGTLKQVINFDEYVCKHLDLIFPDNVKGGGDNGKN